MKTLVELCDEVVAAANAYHELADDRRWNNLHSAIERYNEAREALRSVQKFCWNCKHYDAKSQYCPLVRSSITRSWAQEHKLPNCEPLCKWEEKRGAK